jgi:hypothetical protein
MQTTQTHAAALGALLSVALAAVGCSRQPTNATTAPPPVIGLDGPYLDATRARAESGDRTIESAVRALQQDAEKALALAPMSVMDKEVVPPSGDKHDYMSQAPYWWPDPTKRGGRPYIRRDGERNPEINRITDHDNLGQLIDAVSTLGLAFYFTGREDYARHAALLVRTWFLDPGTRMNPHLRFGQGIPGITEGRGIGIIETRGLPELIDGVLLVKAGEVRLTASAKATASPPERLAQRRKPDATRAVLTADDEIGLQAWMREYLLWLVESVHGKDESKNGNNHETWYDVQVASLALYTGQRDLARRTLEGSRERIARHIEPDGRQPRELERTRSWDYSIFNLRAFFQLASLGERAGVDLWSHRTTDGRSLKGALDYLVPFAAGDRAWPHPQITPFRSSELHWLLRHAAVAWKEPLYQQLAERVGGGSPRLALMTK